MIENNVSIVIPDNAVAEAIQKIAEARLILKNFLLFSLTPEQRRKMFKMGGESVNYVEKGINYAEDPDLRSKNVNLDEWKRDFEATRQFLKLNTAVEPLFYDIQDMMMLCGIEAIDSAQVNYRFLRYEAAENNIKARGAYEDLKEDRWNLSKKAQPNPNS